MQVQIRLGAGLSGIAGRARLTVDLQDGATAADLLENVRRELPVLGAGGHILCVVDGSQVSAAQVLPEGKEVALLSPAAGG